jgi:hypothetical protein
MGDQFSYLNNLNKANLVDLTLLQKINEGYNGSTTKSSYVYSLVQSAGATTCRIAKDNLFITIIVFCLVLFLIWCYVEKQRQNAMYEKYLQKKLAKSLLSDELNLFTETPNPINMEKLFVDINDTIEIPQEQNPEPVEEPAPTLVTEPIVQNQQNTQQIKLTKREANLKIYDANQRVPTSVPDAGNVVSDKFMSFNDFNGSYMLM